MADPRGGLDTFAHTADALRFCRWGEEEAGVTLAEVRPPPYNASELISCPSADMGADFAGSVSVFVSLNGRDYSDTGLDFTYYRTPRISRYTPHGGPAACTESARNGDGSRVSVEPEGNSLVWDTDAGTPQDGCELERNWRTDRPVVVTSLLAAGMGRG